MEIRVTSPDVATYVDTSIPKVADTPLEGSDACTPQTYGPFESDPTTSKTPNSKGYSVRFEGDEPHADPIENAIDSIILFIDDLKELPVNCVAECRNPCADSCVDSFETMASPVDLMLDVEMPSGPVEEEKREDPESEQAALKVTSPPVVPKPKNAAPPKQNAVEEFSTPPVAAREPTPAPTTPAPSSVPSVEPATSTPMYSHVETVVEKMRTLVSEDTMRSLVSEETLQMLVDKCVGETGEVRPDAAELILKSDDIVDDDPLVELIDRLIMFFDDLHETAMVWAEVAPEVQASLKKKKNRIIAKKEAEETKMDGPFDYDRSDNTTRSEDTMKTTNSKKMKAPSVQEFEEAAELLHQRALEQIMAEHSEDEGFADGKTEISVLEDLIKEADQAILDARNKNEQKEPIVREEQLIVLGHSATLTPIPEADEASAATPASDMIEQGVLHGTIPQVPLPPVVPAEAEKPKSAKEEEGEEEPLEVVPPAEVAQSKATGPVEVAAQPTAAAAAGDTAEAARATVEDATNHNQSKPKEDKQEPQKLSMVEEEQDPIIRFIDGLFLAFDDIQEKKTCEGCIGASVPSDLEDDIIARDDDKGKEEEETEKKEELEETAQAHGASQAKIGPRLTQFEGPHDSRGQKMLEEALKLVKEASSVPEKDAPAQEAKSLLVDPASDVTEKLAANFEEAERAGLIQDAPTSKLVDIEKKIITAHGIELPDTEKNRAIAKLVEAAFNENEKVRQAWQTVVEHPEQKGKERDPAMMTPQMSLEDPEKQQTKVEFEIPEMMKNTQDPYIAWNGDDSELMASINADRKLSEMEHENIFRDVSKGLQESSGGVITRVDNQDVFSIYNAPAFTEGNSSSVELPDDRFGNPAQGALKVLCAESSCQQAVVASQSGDAASAKDTGKTFAGWSLSKKREEMLRSKLVSPGSI